jgi:hypothetical protein
LLFRAKKSDRGEVSNGASGIETDGADDGRGQSIRADVPEQAQQPVIDPSKEVGHGDGLR